MKDTLNPNGCPNCGSTAQYKNGTCGCGYEDPRNNEGEPLNQYGEVATHEDCIHNAGGGCQGWMCWWENPRSYNRMLMCAEHAERSDKRQSEIFKNYYFDGAEA